MKKILLLGLLLLIFFFFFFELKNKHIKRFFTKFHEIHNRNRSESSRVNFKKCFIINTEFHSIPCSVLYFVLVGLVYQYVAIILELKYILMSSLIFVLMVTGQLKKNNNS